MRSSVLVAFLMGLTLAVGAASASSAVVEFKGPSEAWMIVDAEIKDEDASQMREFMDSESEYGGAQGNNDGTVQQNEVDAVEEFFKGFFSMSDEDDAPTGSMTMDGKAPTDFSLEAFDIRDATGPVTSTETIIMHIEFSTTFDVEA